MICSWFGIPNKYQVSQVSKEKLEENQDTEGNFDFDSVKPSRQKRSYPHNGIFAKLPVIGGICMSPEVEINLPIFKGRIMSISSWSWYDEA